LWVIYHTNLKHAKQKQYKRINAYSKADQEIVSKHNKKDCCVAIVDHVIGKYLLYYVASI
jgi:hypothetical protein